MFSYGKVYHSEVRFKFLTCNLYIDAWFVKINFLSSANLYGLPREIFNSFMKLKWNFVTYVWGFKAVNQLCSWYDHIQNLWTHLWPWSINSCYIFTGDWSQNPRATCVVGIEGFLQGGNGISFLFLKLDCSSVYWGLEKWELGQKWWRSDENEWLGRDVSPVLVWCCYRPAEYSTSLN